MTRQGKRHFNKKKRLRDNGAALVLIRGTYLKLTFPMRERIAPPFVILYIVS
jgi:hypothetical protein